MKQSRKTILCLLVLISLGAWLVIKAQKKIKMKNLMLVSFL